METYELATTVPHGEDCMQLGAENYDKFSNLEADTLIDQIIRQLGQPPEGTYFKKIKCPHDFGTYLDIALVYDENDETSEAYFLYVDQNMPEYWDNISEEKLTKEGYPLKCGNNEDED